MANYSCAIRTNYFHVKDEEKFRDLMGRAYGSEDSISLWEEKDPEGKPVFAFGVYGGIGGIMNAQEDETEDEDLDETSYDEFIDGLQECVADDDAIIIFESGHEKLRYVIGDALVITGAGHWYMDIAALATEKAAEMLGNPGWKTKCTY